MRGSQRKSPDQEEIRNQSKRAAATYQIIAAALFLQLQKEGIQLH